MQVVENGQALQFTIPYSLVDELRARVDKCYISNDHGFGKEVVIYWNHPEICAAATVLDSVLPDSAIPKLPSPMLKHYNWTGIYTPFDHQKETASFLSIRQRAFCFNEAGTGKTSAAIWAADYLMSIGAVKKVLVICPLSIMYSAWQADIFKTAMHRSCGVAYGVSAKRKKIIGDNYDFTIINYDGTHVVFNELCNGNFDLIIVDEANAYKTASTKRWKTLAKMIKPTTWLWMMTGTPASQSPMDAFGLARLVSPNRVPKYTTAWKDKVMTQVTRFKWVPKYIAQDEVYRALQPAIRYSKKECLDLPELVCQTRVVPLTPQVAKFYKALKQQLLVEAAGQQISAVNAAASLSKLLQISGGAVYTDKHQVVEFDIQPRLNALKEVLDETLNKVVIFVPYIHTIDVLTKYLTSLDITNEMIRGSVAAFERSEIIKRFQTSVDPRVLVIQPQSAAHGITLTAADTIVFWSPVMSVETYLQCIGRIERVGQINKMTVVHLQGSEAEKKMYAMLQGKVDSHLKLVDLYKQEIEGE